MTLDLRPADQRAGYSITLYLCRIYTSSTYPFSMTPFLSSQSLGGICFHPPELQMCSSASGNFARILGHISLTRAWAVTAEWSLLRSPIKTKCFRLQKGLYSSIFTSVLYSFSLYPWGKRTILQGQLVSSFSRWQRKSLGVIKQSLRRMDFFSFWLKMFFSSYKGQLQGSKKCAVLVEYLVLRHFSSPWAQLTSNILGHLFHLLYMQAEYIYSISQVLKMARSGLAWAADRLALIRLEEILTKLMGQVESCQYQEGGERSAETRWSLWPQLRKVQARLKIFYYVAVMQRRGKRLTKQKTFMEMGWQGTIV